MCDTNTKATQTATDEEEFAYLESQLSESGIIKKQDGDEACLSKIKTNIPELDYMLGGGLAPGLHCVTGGPSSYKSALLLQIAYLAKDDIGSYGSVEYVTDEISRGECLRRLTSRKLMVNVMKDGSASGVPSWSRLEEHINAARDRRDKETLRKIVEASRDVVKSHRLYLSDMKKAITEGREETGSNKNYWQFANNNRYMVSAMDEGDYDDFSNLMIIDAINSLRLFNYAYHDSHGTWETHDHMPEPRARMEHIVTTLDNFARKEGIAIIGVFHGNRTRSQNPQHPCMGDFKETSAIEYRAVSAWEFVRADDMRWSNHPKPPKVPEGAEAVALYLLKSRAGKRTEHNGPIWLCADGAHNLIYPLE